QRPESGLPQHGISTLGKSVSRMRLPRGRNQSSAERTSIQRPLRAQVTFALVIGEKVAQDGVARPQFEAAAPALIVARLIPQRRVPQSGQTVRCNELSLARREPLSVCAPAFAPLQR